MTQIVIGMPHNLIIITISLYTKTRCIIICICIHIIIILFPGHNIIIIIFPDFDEPGDEASTCTRSVYVIVISQARGMYGIYCIKARGRMPEG